ncbi:MAG: DUF6443 domain-containing protein, partial [Maribacter sp.]
SAASSYTWSIANAGTSTINGNGRVTWASNFYGTATITVRANGNDGSFTTNSTTVKVEKPLEIFALTTNKAPNHNICPGGTLTINIVGSQARFNYQLYKQPNLQGSPIGIQGLKPGTGNSIPWNNIDVGTYFVRIFYPNNYPCGNGYKDTGFINITPNNTPVTIEDAPSGTVCPGTSYTLRANGGSGTFTWYNVTSTPHQNLGTGITKAVTPTSPETVYKVVRQESNCTNVEGFVTINVKPVATAPIVTANITQRCQDNTTPTDFNANKTVTWSIVAGNSTINTNGLVSWDPSFVGNAIITANYDDGCGNPKSTDTPINVVETLKVFAISTDDPSNNVCEGETLTVLLANSQDNVTYELRKGSYSNSVPVQYGTIPQKNGSQLSWPNTGPGQYFIKASNNAGPCGNTTVNTGYIVVTQEGNGAIDITGEPLSVVCPGTSFTLNASPGENFVWTDETNNITIPGYDSITVSPTETTTYRVTGYVNCGEVFNEVTIEVNATPEPVLHPPTICQGEKALVRAAGVENAVYNWYDSSNNLLETNNTFETPILNNNTFYKVQAVSNDGCSSNLVTFQVTVTSQPTWYSDLEDGDGLGDPNDSLTQCDQPNGYVSDNSDLCPTVNSSTNDCFFNVPSSDPSEHNYVYTRTYQKSAIEMQSESGVNQDNFDFFTANDGVIQNITFFDGLGRTFQQTAIDHSANNKKDIVTFMKYDDFGRMDKDWLPYVAVDENLATFRVEAETETNNYYQNEYSADFQNTVNPYSEKFFEPSPLNRVLKQAAPGNDWALNENGEDHAIEFGYDANEADEVRLFNVNFINDNTELPELTVNNFYEAGQLYKNITRDENHSGTTKKHTTEEFTDKQGRVVLKRTYADVPAIDLNNDGDKDDLGEQARLEAPHDTYYVYDDYGNLTFVLPPKMEATEAGLSTLITNMDALAYQYKYDHRNRLVEKQIPGKDEEYIVYNKLDQPILTQDANLRERGEWLFTKYDAFGRVAYTGIATLGSLATVKTDVENSSAPLWVSQTETSTAFGGVTDGVFYSSNTYPNTNTEILTINYYDNYVARPPSFPTSIVILDSDSNETYAPNVKGLPTVSKVKVLENDDWISTLSYYEEKGRGVYSYSENSYLSTVDIMETALDFVGKPLKTRTEHRRGGNTIVTIDNFTYDHVGRLLSQTRCIGDATMGTSCESTGSGNTIPVDPVLDEPTVTQDVVASNSITIKPGANGSTIVSGNVRLYIDPNGGSSGGEEELIVFNSYDDLGQLQAKKVGGTPGTDFNSTLGLQTVDYDYNVRGWLKGINNAANLGDDLFAFEMNYNTSEHGGAELFNGNIAETEWKTANDNQLRWYHYVYDPLNRLKAAVDHTSNNDYAMTALYDKNGNITELNRNGLVNDPNSPFGPMDRLSYEYDNGNKLLKVSDIGRKGYGFIDGDNTDNDYNYDANGNMTIDKNKGIFLGSNSDPKAIFYNHLNLPVQINVTGSAVAGNINYVYDATGVKLNKKASGTSNNETEYAGNYIYKKLTNGDSELQFFSHPEGYVSYENGVYKYVYEYKDHLGNTRLSYTDENNDNEITVSTDPMVTEIVKESNYYPFGLEHKGYNNVVNGTEHPYTYNGKEKQEELGLNWLDYGRRNYDPAIGRFFNEDRFAEKYHSKTPYQYAANNPIKFVDVMGDSIRVTGSKSAQRKLKRIIKKGLGRNYKVDINKQGSVTVTAKNSKSNSKLSGGQQAFLDTLDEAINDTNDTSFDLVDHNDAASKSIPVGDNGQSSISATPGTHTLDVSDISKFRTKGKLTASGALGHEIKEGYDIQVKGNGVNTAHRIGVRTE